MATDSHTDASCTVVALVSADCAVSAAARPPVRLARPLRCIMQQSALVQAGADANASHCSCASTSTIPCGRRVCLRNMAGGQAGVLTSDHQADILPLKHGQGTGGIAPAHIAQHKHGVQVAGHRRYRICSAPFWECLASYSGSGRGTPSCSR